MEIDGYTINTKTGKRTGYVYVVKPVGHNVYKIGATINLKKRMERMVNTYKCDLEYVAFIPYTEAGYTKMEAHFHLKFKHRRLVRDWFLLSDEDIEFFVKLQEEAIL